MDDLFEKNKRLIYYCADKLCYKYNCNTLKKDLVSIGNMVLMQKEKDYNSDSGTTFITFVYPFIMGAMRREIEKYLFPLHIPKDEFQKQGGLLRTAFVTLGSIKEQVQAPKSVEEEVLTNIYLECLKAEFDKLSFKEKQIIGGFFGVFGHPKQTIAELAEEFQMTENALGKAKDKAMKKITTACHDGLLGIWRDAVRAFKDAKKTKLPY